MTLKEYLKRYAKVGEVIVIRERGWQIALAQADNEELYIHSLHPRLLELYSVVNFEYARREWATKHVLVVDILPTTDADAFLRDE